MFKCSFGSVQKEKRILTCNYILFYYFVIPLNLFNIETMPHGRLPVSVAECGGAGCTCVDAQHSQDQASLPMLRGGLLPGL